MFLGHILVMLVHAPATDRLPLHSSEKTKGEDTFGRGTEIHEQGV